MVMIDPVSAEGVPAPPTVPEATSRRRHPVASFLLRRFGGAILTLLVASFAIFMATSVLPGNTAEVVLGRSASPQAVQQLEQKLGIEGSVPQRYLTWLGGVVRGDFGDSAIGVAQGREDASVLAAIRKPLLYSSLLAAITALILIPLTLLLGGVAGIRAGRRTDHAISLPSLVLSGLPEFVVGTGLIFVFFSLLGWLPPNALMSGGSIGGYARQLVLPALTLLAVAVGSGIRQVRSGMMEVLEEEYVRYARLNGVRESRVLARYALRNALAPSVQILAQNLQYLVGGIIIVESVFSYPGLGTFLVNAVSTRDVVEVQAAAIILAAVYITFNVLADLIVIFLVPRLRTAL